MARHPDSGYTDSESGSDTDDEILSIAPTQYSLADHLQSAYSFSQFNDSFEKFLPETLVGSLVTDQSIIEKLGTSLEAITEETKQLGFILWIREKAPKVFLILTEINVPQPTLLKMMWAFKRKNFDDSSLPVNHPSCTGLCKNPCKTFPIPKDCGPLTHLRAKFHDDQWRFLSPIFRRDKVSYDMHVKEILPIIHKDTITENGAFSSVFKVTLHPNHFEHGSSEVAIKDIRINHESGQDGDTDAVWDLEARALDMANAVNHNHMVKCLAAIRKGNRRLFMFPWARGGSLRDFWKGNPKPVLTRQLVYETVKQLYGLADALFCLHNYDPKPQTDVEDMFTMETSKGHEEEIRDETVPEITINEVDGQPVIDQDESGIQSIRHGDLKPENILSFFTAEEARSSPGTMGELKIADMGLAKRHVVATQLRNKMTSTRYGTALYEAPEAALAKKRARSRLYDVWSMGCIVFEFILWMLYGNDIILDLHDRLKSANCQYYEIVGQDVARVHPIVHQWIAKMLRDDPECAQNLAIGDLLRLVASKLLVVDISPRGQSGRRGESLPPAQLFEQPLEGNDRIQYRGTSEDLRDGLKLIMSRLEHGKNSFTGVSRTSVIQPNATATRSSAASPSSVETQNERLRGQRPMLEVRAGLLANGSGTKSRTAKADYTLPPLEDWEFAVDDAFALSVLREIGMDVLQPVSPKETVLCQRCMRLDFWKGGFAIEDKPYDLQRRAMYCSLCLMLWKAHQTFGTKKARKVRFERFQSSLKLSDTEYPLPALTIIRSPELKTPTPIQIGSPELSQPGTQRFFHLLKLWLGDCDTEHEGCRAQKHSVLPTRLIEVGTMERPKLRLIDTAHASFSDTKYIALSHPWGDQEEHPPFSTLRRDPSGRGRELTAFKSAIPFDQLPATFRDAVLTTRALQIPFLWIDSICIIQGEDGDFNEESKKMEDVFSCAYCVLAASRAKGQHDGFLQMQTPREYLTIQQVAGKPFYICEAIDDFSEDVLEGSLSTRGWTLQERALARRTIFFTENQAYFECGQGVQCQSLTKMRNNMADFLGDPNFPNKAMNVKRGLKIRYFQDLYKQYSRLNFTHMQDRPFAIRGLENRLCAAYRTNGAYGIFDDGQGKGLFHRSLLWQRGEETGNHWLKRIDFSLRKITVPTWSWMAFEGGIDYLDPPFDQTVWETKDIHPPRAEGDNLSGLMPDTLDGNASMELIAMARHFNVAGHLKHEINIIYDIERGQQAGARVQCVVVANSRDSKIPRNRKYYVLLVSQLELSGGVDEVYERVGAGWMLEKFIDFGEPARQVRIR